MFGTNKITKPSYMPLGMLSINSIFKTIQGEGPFQGEPALFIRFKGCNLKCKWCDTEFEKGNNFEIEELIEIICSNYPKTVCKAPLIVITGGEPFLQPDLTELCKILILKGFRIQIETAGTIWQPRFYPLIADPFYRDRLTIVCSPKTREINKDLAYWIHSYKYVLKYGKISDVDGLPIEIASTGNKGSVARYYDYKSYYSLDETHQVYVVPCDEHDEPSNILNTEVVVEVALKYGYRVCLQIHKLLDLA